jgi:glutamate racemase
VRVFSQADIVAESLADYLSRKPAMSEGGGNVMFTTGDPKRVSARATQFLRRPIAFEAA